MRQEFQKPYFHEHDLLREVLAMYVRAPQNEEPTERELGILEELGFHFAQAMERGALRQDFAADRLAATGRTFLASALPVFNG